MCISGPEAVWPSGAFRPHVSLARTVIGTDVGGAVYSATPYGRVNLLPWSRPGFCSEVSERSLFHGRCPSVNDMAAKAVARRDSAAMWRCGGSLVLGIAVTVDTREWFSSRAEGMVYILATPHLDPDSQTERFLDVGTDAESCNHLLHAVGELGSTAIAFLLAQSYPATEHRVTTRRQSNPFRGFRLRIVLFDGGGS